MPTHRHHRLPWPRRRRPAFAVLPGAPVRIGVGGGRAARLLVSRVAAGGVLVACAFIVGVIVAVPSTPVLAARDDGARQSVEAPGAVFARLAAGFDAGDAGALAALVHREGLSVTDRGERSSEYSPSQAVYYFKNLFQGHRTLMFAYRTAPDDGNGGRARAMAEWKRRRVDSELVVELQVVLVLALDEGRWRLAEINMVR